MAKDAANFLDTETWTSERFDQEYKLIKEKKSKLPANQRKIIVELIENPHKPLSKQGGKDAHPEEKKNQETDGQIL
jgi:hypothetical protein